MASSSSGITGTMWNPKADDPYPIESTLAQAAVGDPVQSPLALSLLDGYQRDRQSDVRNYTDQLGQQRMYAQQVLAAQIGNERQQRAMEGYKIAGETPGAYDAMLSNPTTSALYSGTAPSVSGAFDDWSARMNAGKLAEALGKGAQGFENAGIQMPPGYATGLLPGSPAMSSVDPPLVAAAKIKEAGANARHAVTEGDGSDPKTKVVLTNPDGTSYTINTRWSNASKYKLDIPPSPNQSSHVGEQAPSAQPAAKPGASVALQPVPNNEQGTALRAQVASKMTQGGGDAKALADVKAKGTIDLRHDPATGNVYAVGASGKPYRVQ